MPSTSSETVKPHKFHFFRAGAVDQVSLRDGADLRALHDLDQKLWVALAMPVTGIAVEPETVALLDHDKDGRIRVQDILIAVDWIAATFVESTDVLTSKTEVALAKLKDPKVIAAAKQVLADLKKSDAKAISIEDVNAITKAFVETKFNGDGIVIVESAGDNADLIKLLTDAIAAVGSVADRSGKPGIDKPLADAFFAAVDERSKWLARGKELATLGEAATAAAADALTAVRAKIDDYFTRCQVAAFDARGTTALAGTDADIAHLADRSLTLADEELAKLPLARLTLDGRLDLARNLNPAWQAEMATFVAAAVKPILGPRDHLTLADLNAIIERLKPYLAWRAEKPLTKADALDEAWLAKLAAPELRVALDKLIADDSALAEQYAQIVDVTRAVRFQRDFGRILRNFVSFSDFYNKQDGIFQAGTLYLDARALHLTVPVADVGKHAALATSSDSFLIYCDISRGAEKKQICAALTNGDAENVFVGRNGIFYDRLEQDWDATVIKVLPNPISIREAFWSPYKKLVKTIEDNVTKRAQAADGDPAAKIEAVGKAAAEKPESKIDLGTVAAIGVAIGGIGTLVGALLAAVFGLGAWLPLGLIALVLLVSGPAMLLAYLKLRRRNLGPILDANGWAVNTRARINVSFGAAMTELAKLPPGSTRSTSDPFADKKTPWKRWVFLVLILVLAGSYYFGKLDSYLPERIRSTSVLGAAAPASVPTVPAKTAPAAAPPTPGAAAGSGSGSAAK